MWDNGPLLDVSVLVTYEELFRLRVLFLYLMTEDKYSITAVYLELSII